MLTKSLTVFVLMLSSTAIGDVPDAFQMQRVGTRPRPENVKVVATPERVTIVVAHDFGIGGGAVRATANWPDRVTVRFENFRSLESLRLSNAERRVESRLGFGDETSTSSVPSYPATSKDDAKPLGKVELPIVRRGKHIEAELPKELIPAPKGTLKIHWVDAFRG